VRKKSLDRFAGTRRLGHGRLPHWSRNTAEAWSQLKIAYAVSTLPVRDAHGAIVGWVRADPFADGTKPTDTVVLRDGSVSGQAEAAQRIALDPSLLYPTRDAAVQDGLARLLRADGRR
jgi:hypothetical protein